MAKVLLQWQPRLPHFPNSLLHCMPIQQAPLMPQCHHHTQWAKISRTFQWPRVCHPCQRHSRRHKHQRIRTQRPHSSQRVCGKKQWRTRSILSARDVEKIDLRTLIRPRPSVQDSIVLYFLLLCFCLNPLQSFRGKPIMTWSNLVDDKERRCDGGFTMIFGFASFES